MFQQNSKCGKQKLSNDILEGGGLKRLPLKDVIANHPLSIRTYRNVAYHTVFLHFYISRKADSNTDFWSLLFRNG